MAEMRREAFPVEGPVALVVRAPAGVVEIDATDVSEAVVELEALRDSAEGPVHDAIVELRPGSDRAELLVDIQHGFRVGGRRGPRLSIVFGQGPSIRAGHPRAGRLLRRSRVGSRGCQRDGPVRPRRGEDRGR